MREDIRRHVKAYNDNCGFCKYCGVSWDSSTELKEHMKLDHNEDKKSKEEEKAGVKEEERKPPSSASKLF